MDTSVSFLVSSLIISIIMGITYFARKKVNTNETKVYSYLMVISILGLIISIPLYYVIKDYQSFSIVTFLLPKLYLLYLMVFVFTMTCYFKLIATKVKEKYFFGDVQMFFGIYLFVNLFILLILPMEYHNSNGNVYINGYAVYYTYFICALQLVFMLFTLIKNITVLRTKKVIPVIALIIIGVAAAYAQFVSPGIRIISYAISLIVQIMFFTIENPDVQLLEQVRQAKDEAEKANKTKSDFLSIMSHEIRTPLNTIVGFSDSLKEEPLTKIQHEEIQDIYNASLNILETVNGIIDISKLENNTLEIEESNYQFSKIYNDLVLLTRERLKENKEIKFKTSISEDVPKYLYGDSFRIKQVILNLLTNAVKYTKEGYITFGVNCINKDGISRLVITVEDSGIGIKKSNLKKIFNDREINNKNVLFGTGLGLSVTKKLVDLMNGQILVQSVFRKGTQFKVIIDQKIVDELDVNKKENIVMYHKLDQKKVLVVDDNNVNIKVAKRFLEKYDINVETATSGQECLNLVKNNQYDLILLDDMMPKMSGKETYTKLKEDTSFTTPVVVLTANAVFGVKEEYLEFGFNDYLAKPIEKEELKKVIKKYLDK